MPKSRGFRFKSRKLMTKKEREKRKGIARKLLMLQRIDEGERVLIKIDSAVHKGMPHKRYHGRVATILGRKGRALEVITTKGRKKVTMTIRPEHLEIL